jgi:beta-glucanase (GH16 family)
VPARRPDDAPPIPSSSRPAAAGGAAPNADDDAPPPYSPTQEEDGAAYWTADFSPDAPVGKNFDFDLGAGGWGNAELQTYTSFAPNAFHTPAHALTIRAIVRAAAPAARDRHTSARLVSKQRLARRRGYVGAALAAPCAAGVWPAFWLLPEEPFSWPTDGEVDVFEAWNGAGVNHACLHWGGYSGTPEDKRKHRIVTTPIERIREVHTYGFAWEQPELGFEGGRMVWYVDGAPVMKAYKPEGTRRFEGWRVLLNVALGGNVCDGRVPADGEYDMVVDRLVMCESPPGGWEKFDMDWHKAPEGRTL